MVVLAAADVLFTTWATVIDTRRFSAVALLGIPATVAALTAAPASFGTRRPVAQILQAETT
jgi:hypothetical protein